MWTRPRSEPAIIVCACMVAIASCSSSDSPNADGAAAGAAGVGAAGVSGTGAASAAGSSGAHASAGTNAGGSSGANPGVDACPDTPNAAGTIVDLQWPALSNVGHDALEGQTFHFHWTDSHNVLQVASFEGQESPTATFSDAGWPAEIKSGAKQQDGAFDWNTGTFPCGYRPGIYFFVDESNPAGGIVSATLTVDEFNNDHYAPKLCSSLNDPMELGGRYNAYASRAGCTVHEVNNFQTAAHFDWVPATFGATQGDLVVFRWTGKHNVVQVHDVTLDAPMPNGINSGPKTNCVGGPHYLCANGSPDLGEFAIDTNTWRPGMIHISDECAMTCTGHTTGMNMQFLLSPRESPSTPVAGACCAIKPSKGAECRLIDVFNAGEGNQFPYLVGAGRGDLVRIRWSGKLRLFQSTANADGTPSSTPKQGGVGPNDWVECTPGPNMSCLEGTDAQAELIFDPDEQVKNNNFDQDPYGAMSWHFHADGVNTDGFSSQDTGMIVYLDSSVPYPPTPTTCP